MLTAVKMALGSFPLTVKQLAELTGDSTATIRNRIPGIREQIRKSDLQNKILDRFYSQLKMGSLVGHESTWQMAIAMAIGRVKDKFEKMKRTATGTAVWVNTLDVYKYVGAADITMQTAFSMNYIKNFLGADICFISSQIPENTVIATPLNNLVAYYVDPADSEFVKAGLAYTVDSATGFIGFHAQGTYERAISDMFAIVGVRLFAEYLDAIAYIAVGSSDTQTIGKLTLTSAEGSEEGKTKIAVKEQLVSINDTFRYKTNASAATEVTFSLNAFSSFSICDIRYAAFSSFVILASFSASDSLSSCRSFHFFCAFDTAVSIAFCTLRSNSA